MSRADDGTVTVMARNEPERGEATVYWPLGAEWGTAQPRSATEPEIANVTRRALEKF